MSASGTQARGEPAVATPPATGPTNWYITAALPRQQISRISVGLAAGARGWVTLRGAQTPTLFYPLTPTPEDPDLLVVGSPLSDERSMTWNGTFLGVLAQDCQPTWKPGRCAASTTLAVSGDAPAEAEPGWFGSVELTAKVVADARCEPATPRGFTVERTHCPGAELGGPETCFVDAARDGGYWIGPFRVLIAAWVGMCGV
jgi:hypothetical protein